MKVKIISRDPEEFTRSRSQDLFKLTRNYDPALHPFEKAREYTRALNSVKLDRVFAKPFVAALSGHIDGVYSIAKHPRQINIISSASADGQVRIWSLSERKCLWQTQAHSAFARGICFSPLESGDGTLITCGDDRTIKIWNYQNSNSSNSGDDAHQQPLQVFRGQNHFSCVDHHYKRSIFASAGSRVDIWDQYRSQPVQSFSWGADTINTVRFSPTEVSVFASAGNDRTVILYDLRYSTPVTKAVMSLKANSICWNPIEPFNFAVASEDHNCYLFDMRKMSKAINIYKDHVSAVTDLDFSPTGQEIVTASYDKTIRIFNTYQGHSREVYHTKRMQHAFSIRYSLDSKYIISGSDDGNVRLWKTKASESMAPKSTREQSSLQYADSLKQRYAHMPELRKIQRNRPLPKSIKSAQSKKRVMLDSIRRREDNRRRHEKQSSSNDSKQKVSERQKAVVLVEK